MRLIPVDFIFNNGLRRSVKLQEDHYFLEAVNKGHNHFGMIQVKSGDTMMIVNSGQVNYFIIKEAIEVTGPVNHDYL